MNISLVITTKNEAATIERLFESIGRQTRIPDEIVVVDADSKDDTVEVVRMASLHLGIRTVIVGAGDVNIARGRNIGIEQSEYDVIAVTDGGCSLDGEWLANLERAMEDEGADAVFGTSYATGRSIVGKCYAEFYNRKVSAPVTTVTEYSSRSVMFTKRAWMMAGGYPEWLSLAGEDTLFFIELEKCCHTVHSRDAIVYWAHGYETLQQIFRVHFRNSIGSGEASMGTARYLLLFLVYVIGLTLIVETILLGWFGLTLISVAAGIVFLSRSTIPAVVQLRDRRATYIMPLFTLYRDMGLLAGYMNGTMNRYANKRK